MYLGSSHMDIEIGVDQAMLTVLVYIRLDLPLV